VELEGLISCYKQEYEIRINFFGEYMNVKKKIIIIVLILLAGIVAIASKAMLPKGYPEGLLYTSLFVGILYISQRFAHKKITDIVAAILLLLISFMSIMGFIMA
jgi:hypothetical protein